ncbi:MAG: transcription antitermination factor NusB [Actinomycetota bacterium]
MTARHAARRQAVELLYQGDITGEGALGALAARREAGEDVAPFAAELVEGVAAHLAEIDATLGEAAERWSVDRMAAVDRAILRLACLELLHRDDVPDAVAIDEAVEAAKALSTEDSARFVHGVLGRIARGAGGT